MASFGVEKKEKVRGGGRTGLSLSPYPNVMGGVNIFSICTKSIANQSGSLNEARRPTHVRAAQPDLFQSCSSAQRHADPNPSATPNADLDPNPWGDARSAGAVVGSAPYLFLLVAFC